MPLNASELSALSSDQTKECWFAFRDLSSSDAKELAHAMKHNTKLEKLNLNGNSIGDEGLFDILETMKMGTSLMEINLAGNQLTDKSIIPLAHYIARNRTVSSLCLIGNSIGDEGARAIAQMIRTNTYLECLFLYLNEITDDGMLEIADALQVNRVIETVWLDHNPISVSGSQQVIQKLQSNQILTTCELTIAHDILLPADREVLAEKLLENIEFRRKRTQEAKELIPLCRSLIQLANVLPADICAMIADTTVSHFNRHELATIRAVLLDKRSIGKLNLGKSYTSWSGNNLVSICNMLLLES